MEHTTSVGFFYLARGHWAFTMCLFSSALRLLAVTFQAWWREDTTVKWRSAVAIVSRPVVLTMIPIGRDPTDSSLVCFMRRLLKQAHGDRQSSREGTNSAKSDARKQCLRCYLKKRWVTQTEEGERGGSPMKDRGGREGDPQWREKPSSRTTATPLEKSLFLLKHVCLQRPLEVLKESKGLTRSSHGWLPLHPDYKRSFHATVQCCCIHCPTSMDFGVHKRQVHKRQVDPFLLAGWPQTNHCPIPTERTKQMP